MKPVRKLEDVHPSGEDSNPPEAFPGPRKLDAFGGVVEVEWEEDGAAGLHGGLVYFIEFLKRSGLWEHFVEECPLEYVSPNAPSKEEILGTILFSVLSGHHRHSWRLSVAGAPGYSPVPQRRQYSPRF